MTAYFIGMSKVAYSRMTDATSACLLSPGCLPSTRCIRCEQWPTSDILDIFTVHHVYDISGESGNSVIERRQPKFTDWDVRVLKQIHGPTIDLLEYFNIDCICNCNRKLTIWDRLFRKIPTYYCDYDGRLVYNDGSPNPKLNRVRQPC